MTEKNRHLSADDEILTAERVAEILGVTQKTVEKEIREGRLEGRMRLRKWYIFRSDLHRYVETGRKPEDPTE